MFLPSCDIQTDAKKCDLRRGFWQAGRMNSSPSTFHAGFFCGLFGLVLLAASPAGATNYDESKVGSYTLPDPLVCNDGSRVTNAETWFARRRPEILEAYRAEIFGRSPAAGTNVAFNAWEISTNALGGAATRKQIEIDFSGTPDGPFAHLLLYTPAGKISAPTFLCLQFNGNYTVDDDPAIAIFPVWNGKTGAAGDAEKSRARRICAQLENRRNARARLRHCHHGLQRNRTGSGRQRGLQIRIA